MYGWLPGILAGILASDFAFHFLMAAIFVDKMSKNHTPSHQFLNEKDQPLNGDHPQRRRTDVRELHTS